MTTDEPDLSGLVLDERYELVRLLGAGGMGSVYEARHVRIAKSVAVKVLKREFAYKESFRRRFLREAQAASLIRHKHVVEIHDFGDNDDVAYIVMELLEGRDLHVLIHERAPLPWAEARSILLQTAAALGAAHDCGVIHRDVKPANVFIADDPHDGMVVKVLDFGIARASTMTPEVGDQGATGSSRVFGTPTYMAPEIAFGEPADGRSDLYSLGVVAYRVLTGHLPFDGDVPYLVISRHANEPPAPLRRIEPSVPVGVEQVVLKALAKRPSDRFQSMGSFARALASIDEAGHGEVPASLLLETEATAAGPRTEPVVRTNRAQRSPRAAEPITDVGELDERSDGPRRGGPSESSDVGTPVTDLGTERLPSRRRVTGVSDVIDVRHTGFTERVDDEDSERSVRPVEAVLSFHPVRGPSSGQVPVRSVSGPSATVPTARPWGGIMRVLGLVGLVTVAAAVGAIVARTQDPVAPTAGTVAAGAAEPVAGGKGVPREPPVVVPEPRPSTGVATPAAEATADDGTTTAANAPADDGTTTAADATADDGTTTAADTPVATPTPRPTQRKPSDARSKKKLARAIERACGAAAAGYRVTIEGIITAEGRVTGARVLDAPGDARGCITGLVEAQRFPPGELRTLDLVVAL